MLSPASHLQGRLAGWSPAADDTSRTSWRGGVLCPAPCTGGSPDAPSGPVPAARPPPIDELSVRAPGPPGGVGAATRRQVAHVRSLGVASCTTPRLREAKWTPVAGTPAWAPAAHRGAALPSSPRRSRQPGVGAAPPSHGPTRPWGPSKMTRTGSCPDAAGPGTHRAAGGGMQAGTRWMDHGSDGSARRAGLGRPLADTGAPARAPGPLTPARDD